MAKWEGWRKKQSADCDAKKGQCWRFAPSDVYKWQGNQYQCMVWRNVLIIVLILFSFEMNVLWGRETKLIHISSEYLKAFLSCLLSDFSFFEYVAQLYIIVTLLKLCILEGTRFHCKFIVQWSCKSELKVLYPCCCKGQVLILFRIVYAATSGHLVWFVRLEGKLQVCFKRTPKWDRTSL